MTKVCRKCGVLADVGYFYPREQYCKSCHKKSVKLWAEAHKLKRLEIQRVYREKHRDKIREREKLRKAASPERTKELRKKYNARLWGEHNVVARTRSRAAYQKNRENRIRSSVAWSKRNPHKAAENQRLHRASSRLARPGWANRFFMQEIYDLAIRRTAVTGTKWTVDHIVPLRHKLVCGLHCEHNLNVVTKSANSSKGNRHWPDMPL